MTTLFDYAATLPSPPASVAFDGVTYDPDQDHQRLKGQLWKVFELLSDGQWHTLAEMKNYAGGSEAGCSARIRDLKKEQYGGRVVEKQRVAGGLWEYRMMPLKNTTLIGGGTL